VAQTSQIAFLSLLRPSRWTAASEGHQSAQQKYAYHIFSFSSRECAKKFSAGEHHVSRQRRPRRIFTLESKRSRFGRAFAAASSPLDGPPPPSHELEIRGDQARLGDSDERDRVRRVEPDHRVSADLPHRAMDRGEAAEVIGRELNRVVGRAAARDEVVDRLPAEQAIVDERVVARSGDRVGDLAAAVVDAVRRAERDVAMDGAGVDQCFRSTERDIAINLLVVLEFAACSGQCDIAGDRAGIRQRVVRA
jgi:hypothetical protein